MRKRTFLEDILSAQVPLKRIRHMSNIEDVRVGPCPMCIDDTPVTLRKSDKVALKGILPEVNQLWVCDSCLATLTELHDLKLQKVKIEKRIEQISSCIKTVFSNKKSLRNEISKKEHSVFKRTIQYSKTSISNEIPSIIKEKGIELVDVENELEEDLNAENQKAGNDKLHENQKFIYKLNCAHCGKRFSEFAHFKQHIQNNVCSKNKSPINIRPFSETVSNHEKESQMNTKLKKTNAKKSSKIFEKEDNKIISHCDVCRKEFPNQQDAVLHINNKICRKKNYISLSDTSDKFCGVCRLGFLSKEELISHKEGGSCKKQSSFKGLCGYCGKQFYGRSGVFGHFKSGECRIENPIKEQGAESPNICAQVKIEPNCVKEEFVKKENSVENGSSDVFETQNNEQGLEVWNANSAASCYDDYFMEDAFGYAIMNTNSGIFDNSMQPD